MESIRVILKGGNGVHIVMLAGEAVPFAKVGGLGDVLGALPPELEKLGFSVSVVIPRYRSIDLDRFGFEPILRLETLPFDVHRSVLPGSNVSVFVIGNDTYFGREGIYTDPATRRDYVDQADRWIFFQQSAMEFIRLGMANVDFLHCHDHQTALVPAYLQRFYRDYPALNRAGSILTIHNMGYQGIFPASTMARSGFDYGEFYPMSPFEFHGSMNFMKVGIVFADAVTTVSETYAQEICFSEEFGYGLEGVLRDRTEPPLGILNGIDYEIWNPASDPLLPAHYSADRLEGKQANKDALLKEFGLDSTRRDRPLLAMISRIEAQKGFDLLLAILDEVLQQNISFVLLGNGNEEIETQLQSIAERYPGRVGLRLGFNNQLAHVIEAGADIFLMPSKYEPCGLNQMYSMHYGTVPVVRATGGLADTVREFEPATGEGTGFRFEEYTPLEFRNAIARALSYWDDKPAWQRIVWNGMMTDFSWSHSAQRYAELYESVKQRYR
jgi:starch synthase